MDEHQQSPPRERLAALFAQQGSAAILLAREAASARVLQQRVMQ